MSTHRELLIIIIEQGVINCTQRKILSAAICLFFKTLTKTQMSLFSELTCKNRNLNFS